MWRLQPPIDFAQGQIDDDSALPLTMNPAEFPNIARSHERLWWYRGMEAIALDQLRQATSGRQVARVLEAGCGTGHFALAAQCAFGWNVMPWDLSPTALAYARRLGLQHLTTADIRALPVRPESVDVLLCLDVLAHLDPEQNAETIRGFAQALRPGGLLMLRVSALQILRSRHSQFVCERQRFRRGQLRQLMQEAGLRIHRLTYLNALLFPVALVKFRIWEPLTQAPPASGVTLPAPWLNRFLSWPLQIERRLLAAGFNLPIGQSLLAIAEKPATRPASLQTDELQSGAPELAGR